MLDDHGHHHHRIEGVDAQLLDYAPVSETSPLPYFMAMGCTLVRDVKAGELITPSLFSVTSDSILWQLRREQDTAHTA